LATFARQASSRGLGAARNWCDKAALASVAAIFKSAFRRSSSGRLLGRKALITGGDSGMGRAAAIAFAREGADVAINYFPSEEPDARQVIDLIKAEERKGLALPGDIRDETFCQELVRRAVEGLGGLDIMVSNAARSTMFLNGNIA